MNNDTYVIKTRSMRLFLNGLGFNCYVGVDRNDSTRDVYLFKTSDELLEAITFYTKFKQKLRNKSK